MKIRIKFRKWGSMKFIGHLDMMRYFQKVMRRADVDIRYSEGFSPHQIMSFAAPLGVGITSDGEYFDIEVHSTKSSKEMIADMNKTMVEGVEITGYVALPDNAKPAMSIVAAADYLLSYKEGYEVPFTVEEWKVHVAELFTNQKTFTITKKTKKSEREVDLKPLVYAFDVMEEDGKPAFYINVSTGSVDNIKVALELGAKRVGHGIALCKDSTLMKECQKSRLGLELCPTSNFQTRAVTNINTYPLRLFLDNGLLATINTDNRTVSNTNMTKELHLSLEKLQIKEEDLITIYKNSIEISFADDNIKNQLYKLI